MTLAVERTMRPTPRLILIVFLLTQVFDGLLTYTAVVWLGVVGEGNLILATAMHAWPAPVRRCSARRALRPAAACCSTRAASTGSSAR